jgi:hypothetical protein
MPTLPPPAEQEPPSPVPIALPPSEPLTPEDRAWQRRLLPFMTRSIVVMAAFFFLASLAQLYFLHRDVRFEATDIQRMFDKFEQQPSAGPVLTSLDYLGWKASVLLEQELVNRRYREANSVLLTGIWTNYLGFLTGMILALVGAVFILGKLREQPTQLGLEHASIKASVYSSSPGIILATLGSVLMAITIIDHVTIGTQDRAVYVTHAPSGSATNLPLPLPDNVTSQTPVQGAPDAPPAPAEDEPSAEQQ